MKTIKHSCDNPKMGAGKSMGKGYRDGGQVPAAPSRNMTRSKSEVEKGYNKSEYRNTPQEELEMRPNVVKRGSAEYDPSLGRKSGGNPSSATPRADRGGGGGGGGGGGAGGASLSSGGYDTTASGEPDFGGIY